MCGAFKGKVPSIQRRNQERDLNGLWIWESLASKSLAVEVKAEITLERLPPAVLSSKRVGRLVLFLGLHLSDRMLIIKTENPFSSLPVSLGLFGKVCRDAVHFLYYVQGHEVPSSDKALLRILPGASHYTLETVFLTLTKEYGQP